MARLFHRQYVPARWNPDALEGPRKGMTLREWEVHVILCSLPPGIRKALLAWLVATTDPRWSTPDGVSRQPGAESDLLAEITAIRQTLDTSLEALHGITRDLRLVAHGTRLRQIVAALGVERALTEIAAIQRPSRQPEPPRPAAHLGTRWDGRWAGYFSGA